MSEELDIAQIAQASQAAADDAAALIQKAEEAQKQKILNAAELVKMMDTEGYRVFTENLEKLYNELCWAPEQFMTTVTDAKGIEVTTVDTVMVARMAGARETVSLVKSIFANAKATVDAAAEKNSKI